jgi:hypothetical protein
MPRARGLGRRFDDISREIDEYYSGSATGLDVPGSGRPYGSTGRRALFPGGTDFGPYMVDPYPDDPMYYYRGPNFSTRIKAHQFIPNDPDILRKIDEAEQSGTLSNAQFADFNIMGKIYVRFIKKNTLVAYGTKVAIPLIEYRNFRNSTSKGKSVKYLEQYGFDYVGGGPGVEI